MRSCESGWARSEQGPVRRLAGESRGKVMLSWTMVVTRKVVVSPNDQVQAIF